MPSRCWNYFRRTVATCLLFVAPSSVPYARAQGPAPETAPSLFPGGALISYSSGFATRGLRPAPSGGVPATARPTFSHEADFIFKWGFYRNFDLTIVVPIITNHLQFSGAAPIGGTGLGDALVLVKYRFYRRDSQRGTTQASVTLGPKLPTGRTDLNDGNGSLLPASLQPGSGSTDLFVAANWTYTGLFNVKRLVGDEDFRLLARSGGTQATRLGNSFESRFWLNYRPYQTRDVTREWFIGPDLSWLHSEDDRILAMTRTGSGGDVLLAGFTSYVGVRPGLHVRLLMDWDIAHSTGALFNPIRRHISFGITQQFRIRFFK